VGTVSFFFFFTHLRTAGVAACGGADGTERVADELGTVYGAEGHVCASDGELGCCVSLLETWDGEGRG
jgi:hypothetical protein